MHKETRRMFNSDQLCVNCTCVDSNMIINVFLVQNDTTRETIFNESDALSWVAESTIASMRATSVRTLLLSYLFQVLDMDNLFML